MKKILILGASGSIGKNALKVIRKNLDLFTVVGLSAHTNEGKLIEAAKEFGVKALALSGKAPESDAVTFTGAEGIIRMIETIDADIILNGIAGAAGLPPSIAAIKAGKTLALANKETMVMAGTLIN
ncbi:MAG TPA: 1-deoxy-D-xylulose-5-phosphate reductoisomerase, partial [Spirochaetia bacterium]|nr:1-deoxy-D-xylulose-5-phosphate reductoisomerase [Spirochaetia bacterium]